MTRTKPRASGRQARQAAEVLRLLRRLGHGAHIERNEEGGYCLADGTSVGRRIVEACLAGDWVRWADGCLVISHVGRQRLRRLAAGQTDAFQQQHQLRVTVERDIDGLRRQVTVNDGESPLGWLRSRKDRNGKPLLDDAQFEAGERLRADYWFAHMSPKVTANWSGLAPVARVRRGASANPVALRDEVLAAKERVMRALMAVGPEISGILVDICCELKGLEEAEKENGWPQRAGKVVLQIALTRLARHYGLTSVAQERRTRGLRHWGEADYRPRIDGAHTGAARGEEER